MFIRALLIFLLIPMMALANQSPTATQISTNCTGWNKNLNCGMTNQQLVDNAVDQLNASSGGVTSVTASSPLFSSGGTTPNLTFVNPGYMSSVTANSPLSGSGTSGSPLIFTNPGYISSVAPITLASPNVGIGSLTPGQTLDVQGSVRDLGETVLGKVQANSVGIGTYTACSTQGNCPSGGVSQWTTTNTNDVYLPNSGNVGLGTTITNAGAALTIMNGNVGIGTWAPVGALSVMNGNTGIGVNTPGALFQVGVGNVNNTGFRVNSSANISSVGGDSNMAWTGSGMNLDNSATFGLSNPNTTAGSNLSITGGQSTTSQLYLTSTGHAVTNTTDGIIFRVNNNQEVMRVQDNSGTPLVGIGTTFGQAALSVMSGNVGIGTWNPTSTFCVGPTCQTNINASGTVTATSFIGTVSSVFLSSNSSNSNDFIPFFSSGSGGFPTFTNTNFRFNPSTSNLGLGTSIPAGTLDVESTVSPAVFFVNGNTPMQNVGIGTVTPIYDFDLFDNSSSGSAFRVEESKGARTMLIDGNGMSFSTAGTFGGTWANKGQLEVNNQTSSRKLIFVKGFGTQTGDYFTGDTSGNVDEVRLMAGGGAYFLGNVGIGTTVPGQQLDVEGTVRTLGFVLSNNGASSGNVMVTNGIGIGTWMPASTLPISGSGPVNISLGTTGKFMYYTSPSGAGANSPLYTDNTGVSLGNTDLTRYAGSNPLFQVVGTVGNTILAVGTGSYSSGGGGTFSARADNATALTSGSRLGNYGFAAATDTSGSGGNVYSGASISAFADEQWSGSAGGTDLGFFTTTPTTQNKVENMIITGSGNVGIGSLNPTGTGGLSTELDINNNSSSGILGLYVHSTSGSPAIRLSGNTTSKSPFVDLDDNNSGVDVSMGGIILERSTPLTTGGARNDVEYTSSSNANGLDLATNGIVRARIINSGNVGIGSLTPGQLLDVQGTLRMTGIGHISSSGGAPTVASNACGSTTQGTIVAKSTDISGTVTVGTLTVTSCAITFNKAWNSAPVCVANDDTNVLAIRPAETTTGITFTSLSSASGDNISWICIGNE